jgi:hypothetical protein
MRSRTRYSIDRVDVSDPVTRPAGWTFAGDGVHGVEHTYIVTDRNLPTRNIWEFIVRVPDDPRGRIEVRPRSTPNVKVWAELTDRSLTFSPATKGAARGKWYCQVALADASGERSKAVVRTDQRQELPHWFGDVEGRMRRKLAVRSTNGTDGEALVVLIPAGDHQAMIRLFFATKVWVLKEGIQAPTSK